MSATGNLSRNEREDLLRMFELFDTEQSGSLSLLEFKAVLEQVSQEKERPALQRVLSLPAFQTKVDRRLTQEEFVQLLTTHDNDQQDEVGRVFDMFDVQKKGFVSVDDLRRIASELGETMHDDELEEMIHRAASQEGRVTRDDFEAVLNHSLTSSF